MKVEDITKLVIQELKSGENNKPFEINESFDNSDKFLNFSSVEEFKKEEIEFLLALKERIEVLFEGLRSFDKGDMQAKLELNIKFMEFLLANIKNRIENISK